MTRWRPLAAVAGCVAAVATLAGWQTADGSLSPSSWALRTQGPRLAYEVPFGRSAEGRKLVVSAFGTQRVRRKVLVIGCVHGTECSGIAVARRILESGCPPEKGDLWLVPDLNPDGHRLGTRVNARGVDLNRNFAAGWRPIGAHGDPEYSGPRPFSEPESRAARRLIRLVHPAVTIWYHQGQGPVVRACVRRACTRAARVSPSGGCAGSPAPRRTGRTSRTPVRARSWSSSRTGGCPGAR